MTGAPLGVMYEQMPDTLTAWLSVFVSLMCRALLCSGVMSTLSLTPWIL
jgi:hypothetical protein